MPLVDGKSKGGFALGDYVEVKDRIRLFYEAFPSGAVVTGEVRISVDDDVPRVDGRSANIRIHETAPALVAGRGP